MRHKAFLFPLILLCLGLYSNAQLWSGVLSSSRAVDWSNAGIPGGIPNRTTQCGPTIAAYSGSAATINNAIAACPAGQFVSLGSGTFNLTNGIQFNGKNNVTLRGQGANSTLLVFTGAGAGFYNAVVSLEPSGLNEVNDAENNVCDWTAGYSKGTTLITLANCGSTTPARGSIANLKVGSIIILDQLDETADTGQIWNCLNSTTEGGPQCSNNGVGAGGFQRGDGTTIACASCTGGVMKYRSQQQGVIVTAINGANITISPGLYMPNWTSGQKPQAWFASSTIVADGIENLSIAAGTPNGIGGNNTSGASRNIMIGNCDQCWVKGVRSTYAQRSHVDILVATRFEIRDSYFFQNIDHASVSYGVETNSGFNGKVENNIFQQSTDGEPNCNGACAGNVFAYNFDIDNVWGGAGWMQAGFYAHASGNMFNLWEGNIGPGYTSDDVHGTHHFETLFRNRLIGNQDAGCGSTGTITCTAQTIPVDVYAGSRYYNLIGNVLGQSGYHNTYAAVCTSDNSCWNNVKTIYRMGHTGPGGTLNNGFCTSPSCAAHGNYDPQVANYSMRWGNYDTVNNAVRFVNAEVPSGIATFPNPVPASQTLPASFYYSLKPSWWGSVTWPPIGPDVTGGNIANVGGHANMNPAMACYTNVMGGPANGSGSVLPFNADSCYASSSSVAPAPAPAPPTNLSGVVH
jgi:hypothetical protein